MVSRREFLLGVIGGAVVASALGKREETDEIVLDWRHNISGAMGTEIERMGADGRWCPLVRLEYPEVTRFVDRVKPTESPRYRVRSFNGRGKSKWTEKGVV